MLIAAIILISLALPRSGTQKLDAYTQGMPWLAPTLRAPFDIPIYPDDQTRQRIEDSINNNFIRYVTLDHNLADQQIALLNRAIAQNHATTPTTLINAIRQLYASGIVSAEVAEAIQAGTLPIVRRLISDREWENLPTAHMRSRQQAIQLLTDSAATAPAIRALAAKNINIDNYIRANIDFDNDFNQQAINDLIKSRLGQQGEIVTNQTIITTGEIVTPRKYQILQSFEKMLKEREDTQTSIPFKLIGQIIIVALLLLVFYFFMRLIRPRTYHSLRRVTFLILLITIFTILVFLLTRYRAALLYAVPFAIIPIIVSTFYDTRTSFFIHLIVVLLCSLCARHQAEFIIMQFIAGGIVVAIMRELTNRSQLVRCAFLIFLSYCLTYAALTLVRTGNYTELTDPHQYIYFAINCIVLSFANIAIYLVERTFGFTSTMTLVELTDINTPLMRQLSEKCPGTFQHSLQVATLASEAALAINANVQLVRAGALYHDIGKMNKPAFFSENQAGAVNPLTMLPNPQDAAKIVIAHVTDGIALAQKEKLPQIIRDLIAQHHGRGITKYFYYQACQQHPNQTIDPAPYTYPGPNPQSKEAAILMMADAAEAATKSLKQYTPQTISDMVNKVIDDQIAQGLLKQAPINFSDVETIKQIFIKRLLVFYHARIAYPDNPNNPNTNNPTKEEKQ